MTAVPGCANRMPGLVTAILGCVTRMPGFVTAVPECATRMLGFVTAVPGCATRMPGLMSDIRSIQLEPGLPERLPLPKIVLGLQPMPNAPSRPHFHLLAWQADLQAFIVSSSDNEEFLNEAPVPLLAPISAECNSISCDTTAAWS